MSDVKPGSIAAGRQAREAAERAAKGTPATATEPAAEKTSPPVDEAKLPDIVRCLYGAIPYEKFKERYKDVYEGVANGDLFAFGFAKHTVSVSGKKFTLRTLLDREREALIEPLIAQASRDPESDEGSLAFSQAARYQLVIGTVRIDDADMLAATVRLTHANVEAWQADPLTQQRIAFYEDRPKTLINTLTAVMTDMTTALTYAIQESMGNY